MTTLRLDVDDPGLDSSGLLVRAVVAAAEATVLVEGLDDPVTGLLVHMESGWLTLDDRSANRAHTIPLSRVLSITVDYEITDRIADRQATIEQDTAFLDAVERHISAMDVTADPEAVVRATLQGLQKSGEAAAYRLADVAHAWSVLIDQGLLPPVEPEGP